MRNNQETGATGAAPELELTAFLCPYEQISFVNDPVRIPQGVEMIGAPDCWDTGEMGRGVTIAVIDTGCDLNHPDLSSSIIGGRNFTDYADGDPDRFDDDEGHGTHIAGTIGANGTIMGVAPEANLLILKALRRAPGATRSSGKTEWITSAVRYAIEQKADVISMSLGCAKDDPALHDAIRDAVMKYKIPVVCAAGNRGDLDQDTDEMDYPAAFNESISVGAVNYGLQTAFFQSSNNEVDLVAPGVKIVSTMPEGKYGELLGTSMSAAHVSGALALLINSCRKEFARSLTAVELYAQLIKRTVPLDFSPKLVGNGMLDLRVPERLKLLAAGNNR